MNRKRTKIWFSAAAAAVLLHDRGHLGLVLPKTPTNPATRTLVDRRMQESQKFTVGCRSHKSTAIQGVLPSRALELDPG